MSFLDDYQDDDLDFEEDSGILSGDDIEDQDDYEVWKRYIDGNDYNTSNYDR